MENFIQRLQSVLKEKNLSQTELAQELGIRRENFTYWKANKVLPSGELLVRIAEFLDVDVMWLAKGTYSESGISEEEQSHLNKFKRLSKRDRYTVSALCDILLNEKPVSPESETG